MAAPLPHLDGLQNISNVAKSALDAGIIKTDPHAKALLWGQIAALDDYIQEQRQPILPVTGTPSV